MYAGGAATFPVDLGASMGANARLLFVSIFTMPEPAKRAAVAAVMDAVAAGVLGVGTAAGLQVHHHPLADLGRAFEAVEQGAVGKVLVDVDPALG
ncbi:hypothetical protein GCM10009836_25230 [Pseudonocardia ailaonensis]|uniref:Zinc-binding alcohol dehydrogenase family protein n=1 Tax=Pseudonocardia ailaonensis TaxID=367279 RepID=A0ABN2MYV4_9PSEU